MTEIKLSDATKCYHAAEWCKENFEQDQWEMWITDLRGRYTFEFRHEEDAVLFALQWAE